MHNFNIHTYINYGNNNNAFLFNFLLLLFCLFEYIIFEKCVIDLLCVSLKVICIER